MSELTLEIEGKKFEGWSSIELFKSMENLAGTFGVTGSDLAPGNPSKWNIHLGDSVIVKINDQLVMTGYIDEMPVMYSPETRYVQIIGRDKTCDLIDCSYVGDVNEWKNQKISEIITAICFPYNIEVNIDSFVMTQTNKIIDTFKANEGDSPSDLICKLCRDHAILPLSYGDGYLTLTKATTDEYVHDAIELGVNANSCFLRQSNKNRFSRYIVKGYGIGNDNKQIADYIEPSSQIDDDIVDRFRPIIIFSENATDEGKCQDRVRWEARIKGGLSRSIFYTLSGWEQTNGDIWDINKLVQINDFYLDIKDTFLITSVNFIGNENEMTTRLKVMNKETFSLLEKNIDIKLGFDT